MIPYFQTILKLIEMAPTVIKILKAIYERFATLTPSVKAALEADFLAIIRRFGVHEDHLATEAELKSFLTSLPPSSMP